MVIYEKGSHIQRKRDNVKDKKELGTLVLQLPSIHTGGELIVYESDDRSHNSKVIDFGQKNERNEFSIQFAAYYADLEHEVLEIKSGYRLTLVYSLFWANGII